MRAPFLVAGLALVACSVDTIPAGLRATPAGTGPTVVFDLMHTPLPDIPQPNDIATFADPTSRTGRRLDASVIAPTTFEQEGRSQFDEMEGWGTTAPIAVHFSPGAAAQPLQAAIDLEDLRLRMQVDGYDTTNDAVYVVNLTTGVPALLDMGQGNFPTTLLNLTAYYPNDPRASSENLVVETVEEGAGLPQSAYTPSLDTDFDGVLDHPSSLASQASAPGAIPGIDDIMSWYERETDTLLLRPLLPLEEKTEYAVVLTDRLHGPDGQPVRSPFPQIYHPAQRGSVQRLQSILSDATRSNYYGDLAGSGLAHVAFAWTFTTQPIVEDMLLLRDGLYGKGPFARLASQYPPAATVFQAAGMALTDDAEPSGWQQTPGCAGPVKAPFVAHWVDAQQAITTLLPQLFSLSPSQQQGLVDSLQAVDYFVIGTYDTPYLIGDPASTNPWDHWDANFKTGDATVHTDKGHFWLSVPKATAAKGPPFDVAYWHHGTTLFDTEMFIHAGRYAKNGLALVSIDAPGHGMVLTEGQNFFLRALLSSACLEPFTNGVDSGRAVDLDGDGIPDSGGLVWSAHLLRTRDNVRQAVVDAMQMSRVLGSFDGTALASQDYNGDGVLNDLAGDFNGDGVVDVGGPRAKIYASGGSLGGIVSMIQGVIDPLVVAAAPVSGTAGLQDTGMRGTVTPTPVLEQVLGPLVIARPASGRSDTACTADQRSVRWVLNDLFQSKEVEIACLNAAELDEGMTVLVRDDANSEIRCARTTAGGSFRVPIPVSAGDPIAIQVLGAPDAVDSYKTCNSRPGAPVARSITTWEQQAASYGPVGDPTITCSATSGCAQFRATFYPVGSQLVAPQEGLGLRRQTPDFRQLVTLSQAAVDPADPFNYARYYMLRSLPSLDGSPQAPRPLLVATTAGDDEVTTASGLAFARAAGALPFLPPAAVTTMPDYADWATPQALTDLWGGSTPNDVLIAHHQMEGVARLGRTPGTACGINYTSSSTCTSPPQPGATACSTTLFDADWLGETADDYGQQHETPPLRLARLAGTRSTDAGSLAQAWSPRVQGAPFTSDGGYTPGQPLVASVTAYINPQGQHDWSVGDPCQAFDSTTYMDNLLGHFFATEGQDLYYLSHPTTHACLANTSCPFFTTTPASP
ncbi:MAG TPA: hypothetical protein VIF09_00555 [Polyangiaceae bacterium]